MLRKNSSLAISPLLAFATLLLGLGCLTTRVNAQSATTTALSGTVSDSSGAAVAGASVILTNQNTGAKTDTKTNSAGEYAFLDIRPGTYMITVSFHGFQTSQITDRTVDLGVPAHVDVALRVGATAQTVTVSAKGADLLNTTTAEVNGTLNATLVANLPVASQDFLALAALTPGTNPEDALGTWQNNGSLEVSGQEAPLGWNPVGSTSTIAGAISGGQRGESASVSIDGSNVQSSDVMAVTQIQSPSSIQEVRVESGIMNSEFGYGASAINVSTKSGTNKFHGQAFDYLRNNVLDANFLTNIESHTPLPPYRQNEFGAAVGGPILRNKLHFFGDYAGKRAWQGTIADSTVPTASMRSGNFADIGNYTSAGVAIPGPQVYNPYQVNPVTGQRAPFANNIIPMGNTNLCAPEPTCIDPAAAAMLAYTPLPNAIVNNIATYVSTNDTQEQQDQGTGRIDWDKSTESRIYGRYTDFRNTNIATGALPLEGQINPYSSKNIAASWTRTLGPTSVNELWASYTRPRVYVGRDTSVGDVSKQIGLANTSGLGGSPNLQVPGYQLAFSLLQATGNVEDTYQLKDDFSTIHGKHSIKLGFQTIERRYDIIGQSQDKGQFVWADIYSNECPSGNATCNGAVPLASQGGLGFADYLLGAAQTEGLSVAGSDTHQNNSYYGVYVQDSWRILPKLTVNYGLRYEHWKPWHDPRNNAVGYNKYTGTLTYALANPLDFFNAGTHYGRDATLTSGVPKTLVRVGDLDFDPRLGVAYLLTPNTTVRAGAGIFFDGSLSTPGAASGIGPFGYTLSNHGTGAEAIPPYLMRNAFAAPPATAAVGPSLTSPASFGAVDLSVPYKTPTIYEWSFSIEHKFGNSWGLDMTYFGFHDIREPQSIELNPANPPVGANAGKSIQQLRLFPQWGNIGGSDNAGWAKYDALTTTMRSNYWHGLTTLSSFTWSKDKVTASYGIGNEGFPDFRNMDSWAGPSLINPDYRFVGNWTYELPVGKGKWVNLTGPADWILGGWRSTGIAQFMQGGHQWFLGQDNTGTGLSTGYGMDNLVCNPNKFHRVQPRLAYINVACFQQTAFGTFGNSTLGDFIEPGYNNWDLAAAKSVHLPVPKLEDSQMTFRADFFNAFNHTQWSYVCDQYNCRVPGRANGTHNPRQIQFSLQYQF